MSRIFSILFFATIPMSLFCQEKNLSDKIISIAEDLAADDSDPSAPEYFSELLFDLTEDPVNLNSGDEDEISRLFFLSDFQVKALADYVKTKGIIVSPYEIANIPGFDRETVEMMIPFISLDQKKSGTINHASLHQTLFTSFILKKSQSDSLIAGPPWKGNMRYKFTAGNFTGGFTCEKDPGEKIFYGSPPLPDFLSGYLSYKNTGILREIITGDFAASFGQGAALNTGMRTSLSLTTPFYITGRNGIKPYTSADENRFLRGVAAEFILKNLGISLFFSDKKIDVTLNDTSSAESPSIKSFYQTGLHNSTSTIERKRNAGEICYGLNLAYNFSRIRTGLMFSETRFSFPVLPDRSDPSSLYRFSGRENLLLSYYYNTMVRKGLLYGEISYSDQKGFALVQGLVIKPSDRLKISYLFWKYSSGFVNFHGNGPAGSSSNTNETGLLGNITFEAARFLFISAGSEISNYPYLRYRCSAPSLSKKGEVRITYTPLRKISFEGVYAYRYSEYNDQNETGITTQKEINTQTGRILLKFSPSETLVLSSRLDYKIVRHSGSGTLLYEDINFKFKTLPLQLWFRYMVYNTGGFETAIYTWENDLLSTYNIPALYGNGSRFYMMASWKIFRKCDFRVKYGFTDRRPDNSGNYENFDLKFQLKLTI